MISLSELFNQSVEHMFHGENKIRLVWDFRGADALKTAEHQLTHLVEFYDKRRHFLFREVIRTD